MKTRIITAIVGLIIVLPIIIYGELPFIIVTYMLAMIGLFELIRMYKPDNILVYSLFSGIFLWLLVYPLEIITYLNVDFSKGNIIILLGMGMVV